MKYISKEVDIEETHIHFVECGKGKPVVLVHGLTNNWEGHIPLASFLGKTNKLYILDMPGYGDSGPLPHYSIEAMSQCLEKFIHAIGVHPVAIAGLSLGGYIVADFVKRSPTLVSKAIIMGPVLHDVGPKADLLKIIIRATDIIPAGRVLMKKILETKTHGYLSAKYINMYKVNKERIDKYGTTGRKKMTKDVYVEMCNSAGKYDLDGVLGKIRVPTLLLFGKHDRISSPDYAKQYILSKNKRLSMEVVPEAGHVVSFEKPEESAAAIHSFLIS